MMSLAMPLLLSAAQAGPVGASSPSAEAFISACLDGALKADGILPEAVDYGRVPSDVRDFLRQFVSVKAFKLSSRVDGYMITGSYRSDSSSLFDRVCVVAARNVDLGGATRQVITSVTGLAPTGPDPRFAARRFINERQGYAITSRYLVPVRSGLGFTAGDDALGSATPYASKVTIRDWGALELGHYKPAAISRLRRAAN